MTFIFRNRTIFWDILKWNRGQKKWDGGSIKLGLIKVLFCCCLNDESFHCLNTKIRIFITLFYLHIFLPYLYNVIRNLLPIKL